MKGKIYGFIIAVIILQLSSMTSYSQNTFPGAGAVGIGTLAPNASSLLEVVSTTKGVLIPRMTKAQRDAIASPATGLLIYQLNSQPGFYYWSGVAWTPVTAAGGANKSLSNLQVTAINQHLLPSANNIRDLGSASLRWNELYITNGNAFSEDTTAPTMRIENAFAGDGDAIALEVFADINAENIFGIGISSSGGYIGSLGAGYIGTYGFGNFGVVGEALDTAADWAGYMLGDFLASDYYIPSDAKLKNNTKPLTNSLEKIMQLNPMSYNYKTNEYSALNLSSGTQMGLLADEVEKVFPQMVKQSSSPVLRSKIDGSVIESVEFKSVNYIALIPVLVSGMQEQQAVIDEKQAQIDVLEAQNANLESRLRAVESKMNLNTGSNLIFDKATLAQNAPNPFKEKTTIFYYLPETTNQAVIKIFGLNGEEMVNLNISETGNGNVEISGGLLSPGTYTYQLIADGKTIDTKLMVMTK